MKRIRYECEVCGEETKVQFKIHEAPPGRIDCTICGAKDAMAARPANPANHFRPTRGRK